MTNNLPAAIAAAREALAKYQARETRHYLDEAMEGLLAALDAARPVAWPVAWMTAGGDVSRSYAWAAERCMETDPSPLYLTPQAQPVEWFVQWIRNNYQNHPNIASLCDAMREAAPQAPPAADYVGDAGPATDDDFVDLPAAVANVTPLRQPRVDLARLVDAISAAVYANGDGLSVTEAIGALELAKLELLKEQEQ